MAGIKGVAVTAAEITGVTTLKTVLAVKPASLRCNMIIESPK